MKHLVWLLLFLPSCMMAPPPQAGIHAAQFRRDTRNRPPRGLWEIEAVARQVAKVSGRSLAGPVRLGENPRGPVASIRASADGDQITVNPHAAREISPNTWAFIFGHEFAHRVYDFGYRGQTSPQQELRADVIGVRYARQAGYELVPYLHWMLSQPANFTPSHGDLHWRALEMAKRYKIKTKIEGRYATLVNNTLEPRVPSDRG